MMIVTAQSISKMLGGTLIFEDISFEINAKERVGIVGRNGCGKTTLFQLLSGVEQVDDGMIYYKKGTEIGYLAQIPNYPGVLVEDVLRKAFSDLVVMQERMNVLESQMANGQETERELKEYGQLLESFTRMGGYEIDSSIQSVANGLGIAHLLNASFDRLSGGEKTKISLGLLLLKEPDLLLLDEPTNHLDVEAVEWLESFLKQYSGTVLMISHDRYFLDEVVTKIMDLEDGELTVYHGSYSEFVKKKEELLLTEFAAYQEQQKKIKKMREAIKRLREWANQANPPNAALHKRARNMERALERMDKLRRPVLDRKKIGLDFDVKKRSGEDVLTFEDVTAGYKQNVLFTEVDLHIRYGERVAIVGRNGSGKTTLLNVLLGNVAPSIGQVKVGGSVKIGYLSQHVLEDRGEERVIDVYRETAKVSEGDARHELARFLFYGYDVFAKISYLSGGEKMRLRLAELMSKDLNLLVLDEPTNHLDIDSREVLEDAIERFPGTIVCVSHDRYFLNKCFPVTYWIENQHLYQHLYSYSEAKIKHEEMIDGWRSWKSIVPSSPIQKVKNKTKSNSIERELEEIESQIDQIDQKLSEIKDLTELQALFDEKEKLSIKQDSYYDILLEEES
ncbi:ribosomal protection-like ABC-F family protein [Guptibacillus hwajinpoensis]|uniref:ribosomal protection-like ABC-F family protein n=1 Tax=Guptibacillus hwajinpoensis TaxID=208199 RepID=UPI0035121A31